MFLTLSRLCTLNYKEKEKLEIIRNLNAHKAHDDISIRMIKICKKSILKPLIYLFKNSTTSSYYPDICKRSNIIPVNKKNDKWFANIYWPFSLPPISGRFYQKIIFNRIYNFLLEENLLNPNESGFCSFDTCANQLVAITHEIFTAFNCSPPLKVRSVFLDTSKAFNKIQYEDLLNKRKSMGISGQLQKRLEN